MIGTYQATLMGLEHAGWTVERLAHRQALPDNVIKRYASIPGDYLELIESVGLVTSPGDTAWLITSCIFSGASSRAYAWNEWESQSLEAAGSDDALKVSIKSFWDIHLPIIMSVKSGYAYFALNLETLQIVQGEEPIYEDSSPLASSLAELFSLIMKRDPRLQRWV